MNSVPVLGHLGEIAQVSVGVVAPRSQVPTGLQRPLHLCGDPVTLDLRASVLRIAPIHADALCQAGHLSAETWFSGDALRSPRRSRVFSSPPSLVPTGPVVWMPSRGSKHRCSSAPFEGSQGHRAESTP